MMTQRDRRLLGDANYFIVTRSDISFDMHTLCIVQWNTVIQMPLYIKKASGQGLMYKDGEIIEVLTYSDIDWTRYLVDRRSTSKYCLFVRENLVSRKLKKTKTWLLVHKSRV